jgi:hypothetical protein
MKGENILLIISALCLVGGSIVNHEVTHGQIYKYYGCENVSYGINSKGAYTSCLDENRVQSASEILAHSQNEIVGYNITPIMVLIGVIGLGILIKK